MKGDPAGAYVLFRDARDFAVAGGDFDLAARATKSMCKQFDLDEIDERAKLLANASKNDDIAAEPLLTAYLDLVDDAVRKGNLPTASKAVTQAESLSRKTRRGAARPETLKRLKEARDLVAGYVSLPAMQKKLETDPADAPANAVVGKYLCFISKDFKTGLPMLSASDDAALKALATRDLDAPADVELRVTLADDWWKQSEKLTGMQQTSARERSAHWYKLAVPELVGVRKALAEKRLAMVQPVVVARSGNPPAVGGGAPPVPTPMPVPASPQPQPTAPAVAPPPAPAPTPVPTTVRPPAPTPPSVPTAVAPPPPVPNPLPVPADKRTDPTPTDEDSPMVELYKKIPADIRPLIERDDRGKLSQWLQQNIVGQQLEDVCTIANMELRREQGATQATLKIEADALPGTTEGIDVIAMLAFGPDDGKPAPDLRHGDKIRVSGRIASVKINLIRNVPQFVSRHPTRVHFYIHLSGASYSKVD
jgi:hypothetical protein